MGVACCIQKHPKILHVCEPLSSLKTDWKKTQLYKMKTGGLGEEKGVLHFLLYVFLYGYVMDI